MPDESKLWLAFITSGIALLGTLYTVFASHLSRVQQDHFKASTDRSLAEFKREADKEIAELRSSTDREIAGIKASTDQELARLNAGLQAERDRRLAQVEAEKVIGKFRDPLMHAAYDLQSRIFNILRKGFLSKYFATGTPREQEYAVENTVFLLAQFLGWTELIRQEIQFLDLGSDDQTRELRRHQDSLYTQLQAETLESEDLGTGFRLFAGEQRAIGELMIDRAHGLPRCIGFATFLQERDPAIDRWLDPLRDDVRRMSAGTAPFERRLTLIQHTLIDVLQFLDPEHVRFPRSCRTKI